MSESRIAIRCLTKDMWNKIQNEIQKNHLVGILAMDVGINMNQIHVFLHQEPTMMNQNMPMQLTGSAKVIL